MNSPRQPVQIPEIFRNPDGSQWHIFVEAAGITGRPGIIRNLQKAGAIICSDPKKAQVILVDSNSTEGKLFIRDWGSDPNKVVLEYYWVRASIAASKVLGQEDQWGGYLTADDGLPIPDPNSLPTPRITPVAAATIERETPAKPQVTPSNTSKEARQPVPSTQNTMFRNINAQNSALNTDLLQHLPPQTLTALMAQAHAMMQQYMPQGPNAELPLAPGISNTAHASLMNFNQPFFPLSSQGVGSWNLPPGQSFGIPFFGPHMVNWPSHSHVQPLSQNGHIPFLEANASANASADMPGSTAPNAHLENADFSPSISASSANHEEMGSARSSSPIRNSPSAQSPLAAHSAFLSSNSLFSSKKGEQLSFFVQVDLKNRSKVVATIKKHGGTISSSNVNADYAILSSRSKTFSHLLKSTLAAGTPAVNANFVDDSVEQGKVLDTSAYEFETPKGTPRGKRKLMEFEDDNSLASSQRSERNTRGKERRLNSGTNNSSLRKKKSTGEGVPPSSIQGPQSTGHISTARSPTPPPAHTRLSRTSHDGFIYTDEEREYCRRYAKVLLERDHNIPTNAIAQALYTKMDHHSLASWKTFLTQPFSAELETIRKRAGIVHRTVQSALTREAQRKPPDDTQLKREIDIVAQFFATGGGKQATDNDEEQNEGDAWTELSAQAQCRTAENWESFYAAHFEAVKERYDELVGPEKSTST